MACNGVSCGNPQKIAADAAAAKKKEKVYFCIFVTDGQDWKEKLVEITLELLYLYFFVAKDITPLNNPLSLSKWGRNNNNNNNVISSSLNKEETCSAFVALAIEE